jgi:hypothetical protein
MAKSIRSKVMRRHRTALRKAICEPMIQRRQEQLAANLAESMSEKSGKTIAKLRAVFHPNDPKEGDATASPADDMEEQEEEEEEVQEEVKVQTVEVTPAKVTTKEKAKKLKAALKQKSTKQLVWF